MIVGNNSILNQYVPTFYIKDLVDGQTLRFDSVRKAFVNAEGGGSGGVDRLGELLDVSSSVDDPLSLQNGQALVYNTTTSLWENTFIDYNTLTNKPTNASYSFAGLSDTAKPSVPDGYVKWNSSGTQLVYSTTIPAENISGLATVATTGDYNDLLNLPASSVDADPDTLVLRDGDGSFSATSITITGFVVNPTDAATKQYVDDAISGLSWKMSAQAYSVGSVDLIGTTGLVIDGYTVQNGDRVVLAAQTNTSEDGIYVATVDGGDYVLARSLDTNTFSKLNGAVVYIENGDLYKNTTWVQQTVLTSFASQNWQQFTSGSPAYTAGDGINITSDQISVITDEITIYTNVAGDLAVKSSSVAGQVLVSQGSGSAAWSALNLSNSSSISGTLPISQGGTGATTATGAINALLPTQTSSAGMFLTTNGSVVAWAPIPSGTGSVTNVSVTTSQGVTASVSNPTTTPEIQIGLGDITPTSVAASGTVTGSNISGINTGDQTITLTGDVTGSGTGTFATTLATVNASPQTNAFRKITVNGKGLVTETSAVGLSDITTALGYTPYDASNPDGFISEITSSDVTTALGYVPYDSSNPAGYTNNTGTVTSVNASGGTTGLTFTGGPITASGVLTLAGTLSIANGGTGATTATDAINALLPDQTGNTGYVLTTNGSVVSWTSISTGTGTVTEVSATGLNGVEVQVTNSTTTPNIEIDLGDITPISVAATGEVTGSNLSGTNTGDQTIELTGDVTGSGTGTFPTTLATVNITPGTYGDSHYVPTINVNGKGLVTSITVQHVDTTVRDLVEEVDTIVIDPRHQYIVTGTMEVLGRMENNGRIAIL